VATALLLEAAADTKQIRAFVYASSSSVYGDNPALHALREDAELAPVSPYGITKLTCEHLARAYFQLRSVPTIGLRYFTVYGPGQRPDMAFRKFILAARLGVALEVYGNGHQSRDFTFVADAVNATRRAAMLGHPGTVYNIGGGSNVSLLEAVDTLQQIHTAMGGTRLEVTVQGGARPVGDAMHTSADLTRARKELGWAPSWPLGEGLRAQYQWQKDQRR
jgi:UDP-glucose 4-epimerase